MNIVKFKKNAGKIGFFSGFFGFIFWSFWGNISSLDNVPISLFNYLNRPAGSVLTGVTRGLEIQDVLVSLLLAALVAGLISGFIFSFIVRKQSVMMAMMTAK